MLWKMIKNALSTLMLLISLCIIALRLSPVLMDRSGPERFSMQNGGAPHGSNGLMGMSQEQMVMMLLAMRNAYGGGGVPPMPDALMRPGDLMRPGGRSVPTQDIRGLPARSQNIPTTRLPQIRPPVVDSGL